MQVHADDARQRQEREERRREAEEQRRRLQRQHEEEERQRQPMLAVEVRAMDGSSRTLGMRVGTAIVDLRRVLGRGAGWRSVWVFGDGEETPLTDGTPLRDATAGNRALFVLEEPETAEAAACRAADAAVVARSAAAVAVGVVGEARFAVRCAARAGALQVAATAASAACACARRAQTALLTALAVLHARTSRAQHARTCAMCRATTTRLRRYSRRPAATKTTTIATRRPVPMPPNDAAHLYSVALASLKAKIRATPDYAGVEVRRAEEYLRRRSY